MTEQWNEYCIQLLQRNIVVDIIAWGIVLAFFLILLILFCVIKPLNRFKAKAKVVLSIVMVAIGLLALINIIPKTVDLNNQAFITVEDAIVRRLDTYQKPFDSHYINIYSAEQKFLVRLDHSSLIPFDENPDTVYRGIVIYAKNSKTLLYVDLK